MADPIKDLYKTLQQSGLFVDEADLRSQLRQYPKEVYALVEKDGLFVDYADFETALSLKKKEPSSPAASTASALGANIGRVGAAAVGGGASPSTSTSTSPSGLPLFGAPKPKPQDKIGVQIQKNEEKRKLESFEDIEASFREVMQAQKSVRPENQPALPMGTASTLDWQAEMQARDQANLKLAQERKDALLKEKGATLYKPVKDLIDSGKAQNFFDASGNFKTGEAIDYFDKVVKEKGGGSFTRDLLVATLRREGATLSQQDKADLKKTTDAGVKAVAGRVGLAKKSLVAGWYQTLASYGNKMASEGMDNALSRYLQSKDYDAQQWAPGQYEWNGKEWVDRAITSGGQSIGGSLPSLIPATIATLSTGGAAGTVLGAGIGYKGETASIIGSIYDQALQQTGDPTVAKQKADEVDRALRITAPAYLLSSLATLKLVKPGTLAAKAVGFGLEAAEEYPVEYYQGWQEAKATQGYAGSFGDYVKENPDTALDVLVATTGQSTGMAVAGKVYQTLAQKTPSARTQQYADMIVKQGVDFAGHVLNQQVQAGGLTEEEAQVEGEEIQRVAQQVQSLESLGVRGEDAKAYLALSEELQGIEDQIGETDDPTVLSALKLKAQEVEADMRALVGGQGSYVKVTYPGGARQTAVIPLPHFRRLQREGEADALIQSAEAVEVVGDEALNEELQQKKGEIGNASGAPEGFYENESPVSPPSPSSTVPQGTEEERGEMQAPIERGTLESDKEPAPIEGRTPVTLSGLTEEERLGRIEGRKKETALSEEERRVNIVFDKIKEYNELPNGRLGKHKPEGRQLLNQIRLEASELGYTFDERAGRLRDSKNKVVRPNYKAAGDRSIDEGGRVLRDRAPEVQETFERLLDAGALPATTRLDGKTMSAREIEGAVDDITNGIPSQRATRYLDALEEWVTKDLYPTEGNRALPLNELLGVAEEVQGEPMSEEALLQWLQDESELDPVVEEIIYDNLDEILQDYEQNNNGAEASAPAEVSESETGTEDGSSDPTEPAGETTVSEPEVAAEVIDVSPQSDEATGTPGGPPPTDAGSAAAPAAAEEGVGMTHAATAEIRKEEGLPDYEKKPETIESWDEQAKAKIAAGEMPSVIDKMRRGIELTPVEVRMVGMQIATLAKKVDRDPSKENLAALKEVIELSDAMGSRDGKNLRARQGTFLPDDSLAGQMVHRMNAAGVEELTEKQKAEVEKMVSDLKKANEDLTLKIAQLEEANLKLQAEAEVRAARRESKPRSRQKDYKKEREDIKAKIKEKLRKSRGQMNSAGQAMIDFASIAPDVAKLMRSYVEEGVVTLAEIIQKIHADVKEVEPSITEDDIRDIIAGKYNPPRPTKSELMQQIEDLRYEARLINQLEALENGESPRTEKGQRERNQKIKELRDKIKDLRDQTKRDEAIQRNIAKLEAELDRVRERREKEPADSKERRPLTVREQALTEQIKAEKKKWGDEQKSRPQGPEALEAIKKRNEAKLKELQEKLANKDFSTKPRPKSAIENKELKEKHPELWRQTVDAISEVEKARHELHMANLREEMARRPWPKKVVSHAGKTLRTMKGTMAGVDLSMIGVQNLLAILANPVTGVKGIGVSLVHLAKPRTFERNLAEMHASDYWPLVEASGLSIVDPKSLRESEKNDFLNNTYYDDMNVSWKGRKINVAPTKPFERAFTSLGNYLRLNLFLRQAEKLLNEGKTPENSLEEFQFIAQVVNNMTGRGTMGKAFENNSEMLSTIFWSPRLMASAFNVLGIGDVAAAAQGEKGFYARMLTSEQKAWAAYQIGAGFAYGIALMAAYVWADDDAEVDWDPTSVTFGYVKVGDYSWSIFGRFTKPIRYLAMRFTGVKTTQRGEVELDASPFGASFEEELARGARGYLNPIFGAGLNVASGRDFSGQPTDVWQETKKMLYPMSFGEFYKGYETDGAAGILKRGVPSFAGIRVTHKKDFEKPLPAPEKIKHNEKDVPLSEEQQQLYADKVNARYQKGLTDLRAKPLYLNADKEKQYELEQMVKREAKQEAEAALKKQFKSIFPAETASERRKRLKEEEAIKRLKRSLGFKDKG